MRRLALSPTLRAFPAHVLLPLASVSVQKRGSTVRVPPQLLAATPAAKTQSRIQRQGSHMEDSALLLRWSGVIQINESVPRASARRNVGVGAHKHFCFPSLGPPTCICIGQSYNPRLTKLAISRWGDRGGPPASRFCPPFCPPFVRVRPLCPDLCRLLSACLPGGRKADGRRHKSGHSGRTRTKGGQKGGQNPDAGGPPDLRPISRPAVTLTKLLTC
jgi:hypothetical protein